MALSDHFTAGASTTLTQSATDPLEGSHSLEVGVTTAATANYRTTPVVVSPDDGLLRAMVTVSDRGERVEARVGVSQFNSDGVQIGATVWSDWVSQPPSTPDPDGGGGGGGTGGTDSVGDTIPWDPTVFDHVITPAGNGLVSLNGGAAQSLNAAIATAPNKVFRMEGTFRLVGACTSLRGGHVFGRPVSAGGCVMKGSMDLGTSGWTSVGSHWTKSVSFPRLPNHGTVGGNLQSTADVAHGMPEQVWTNGTNPLTPVSGPPGSGQFSIVFNGTNGPHTVRIGSNPGGFSSIELARATPSGVHYAFAGTQAFGTISNIRFDQWAAPLFRAPIGSFQHTNENGLVRNLTVRYCEVRRTTGIGINLGSGCVIDRCLVSDIGQTAIKIRHAHDDGTTNGTRASQTRTRISNSHFTRAPFRRVRIGMEGGLSKHGKAWGGLHIINCRWTDSFGDGLWWDNDESDPDFLAERNWIRNIAKYGMHIEISNPPTGSTKEMVVRWNDIENCGTNQGVAGSDENQILGDGGAAIIVSSSHWIGLRQNRFMARGQSAVVIAAHNGRQGVIGLRMFDNNIGRTAGQTANRNLIQRTLTGGAFSNIQIDRNKYYIPATPAQWNTFDGSGATNRTFTQWQSQLGYDLSGSAGNSAPVPLPTGATAHTLRHYGVV